MEKKPKKIKYISNLLVSLTVIGGLSIFYPIISKLSPNNFWNITFSIPIVIGFSYNMSKKIRAIKLKDIILNTIFLGLFIYYIW